MTTPRRRTPAKPKDGTVTDDNTQRAIGRLEGQMQEVISLLKSQDQRSSDSRARMHEAQEKTAREVHDLSGRVGKVEGAVANMDPVFQRVGSLMERSKGILMVLAIIWLFMGGLILEGVKWIGQLVAKAVMGGP
ncbi:hypothetical protein ASD04_15020 [Devosia sp. Root436]|uniref:DUF1515 domain-containing protein n=1 Tax=Devosia sp. Root436 TaxID=1736537 RepID=UPI0006F4DC3D|nr:DUF1515 domain-containing protein [Devosia sp. Root436]KQX35349.1 hypothetical protein ASD04_15020 [Devosia sp. Root436]